MLRFTIRDLLRLTTLVAIVIFLRMEHKKKLNAVEAQLKATQAVRAGIESTIEKIAHESGYTEGVEKTKMQFELQRRASQGIPPSQKEAAPGIYFLQ